MIEPRTFNCLHKDGTGIGRSYELNSLAHVIGYADARYGTAALESVFDSS